MVRGPRLLSRVFELGRRILQAIPETKKPSLRELAASIAGGQGTSPWGAYGYQFRADIDNIIAKKGMGRKSFYWDMVDSDSELAGMIETRVDNVSALDREVIPASEDESDIDLAQFVAETLGEMNQLDDDLGRVLNACITGASFTEIIWKESVWNGQTVIVPAQLKDRPVDLFYLQTTKEAGRRWYLQNFTSGSISTGIGGTPLEDYPYKFIVHTFRDRESSQAGVSLLRSVYWMWFFKHEGFANWMKAAEMGAEITPIIYYPDGTSDKERDELIAVAKILLKAKYAVLKEGNRVEFPDIKIDANFSDNLIKAIDRAMRYRILGSTLSSGTEASGTRSLGEIHADKEQDRKEHDAKALMGTLNDTLIRWMIDLNFTPPIKYPKIKLSYETDEDTAEIRESLKLGREFGIPMRKTYVAKKLRIEMAPPDTPEEDLVSEIPEPMPILPSAEPEDEEEDEGEESLSLTPKKKELISRRAEDSIELRKKLEVAAVDSGMPVYKQIGDQIKIWLEQFKDIEEAISMMGTFTFSSQRLQYQIAITTFWSLLQGMFYIYDLPEVAPFLKRASREFLNSPKLAVEWEPVPFQEAIDNFMAREILSIEEFKALESYSRRYALSATGMSVETIQSRLRPALERAIAEGITLGEFQDEVGSIVLSPHHGEVIFRTVVQSAYNTGNAEAIWDPDLDAAIPAVMFVGIADSRQTEICAAREGSIYSKPDMAQMDIVPPLHYLCRSTLEPVFYDEFDGKTEGSPSIRAQEGFGEWQPILRAGA